MKIVTLGRYGRYAPPNCATSGYIVENKSASVIIDFGSGCMGESLKYTDFRSVSAIILSHLHYDHMSDLYTLSYFLASKNIRLKLYCPATPTAIVESLKQCNFDITTYGSGSFVEGGFEINTIVAKHTVECYSLVVDGDLLYTADIQNFDNLKTIVQSVKFVIGDACILDAEHGENSPHISVKQLAMSVPIGTQLYLAHLAYGEEARILSEALRYHELTEIVPQVIYVDDISTVGAKSR